MEMVKVEEIPIVEKEEFASFDVEKYRTQVFSMFGGETTEVRLYFVGYVRRYLRQIRRASQSDKGEGHVLCNSIHAIDMLYLFSNI